MIHSFKKNSDNFVLDVNSGAIHVVSDDVLEVIIEREKTSREDTFENLKHKYDETFLSEVLDDLDELIDQGMLYSKEKYVFTTKFKRRKPVIKAMCLHVAHDCNLRCEYCFAAQGNFKGENLLMTYETGKKALDFLVANSGNRRNLEVDMFGGEPLMNWDLIVKLVDYKKELEKKHDKNIRYTLTTNGMLLSDDKLDFINEHFVNVVLSLDGRKCVNDYMRPTAGGIGSYDIIVPKFKKLVEKRGDKSYYLRGTFTNKNLDFDKDVLHIVDQGFSEVSVEPVVSEKGDRFELTEEMLPEIFEAYDRLVDEMVDRYGTDRSFNFFHYNVDLRQGPCLIKRVSGCGAGCEYFSVTPTGDIYPCHQFVGNEDFKVGNVYDSTYDDILQDKFFEANVENKEECKSCWAKYYCSGGCHANAFNQNGDIYVPYKLGCEMQRKRLENAIYFEYMKSDDGLL